MRLPFLRSKDPAAERSPRAAGADDASAVEVARTRARRRLIGALVLLVAGVIGFPLLFETQPRPLPADTPIEVRPGPMAAAPASAPAVPAMPATPPEAGSDLPVATTSAAVPAQEAVAPAPAASAPVATVVEPAAAPAVPPAPHPGRTTAPELAPCSRAPARRPR